MTELEIGFGYSCVLFRLAKLHSDRNFIGIEIDSTRMRHYENVLQKYSNVELVVGNVKSFIIKLESESFCRIHIYFPTPLPRNQRYFNKNFVYEIYRILEKDGAVKIVTDCLEYFNYIEKLFDNDNWMIVPWGKLEYITNMHSIVETDCERKYGSRYYSEWRKIT